MGVFGGQMDPPSLSPAGALLGPTERERERPEMLGENSARRGFLGVRPPSVPVSPAAWSAAESGEVELEGSRRQLRALRLRAELAQKRTERERERERERDSWALRPEVGLLPRPRCLAEGVFFSLEGLLESVATVRAGAATCFLV